MNKLLIIFCALLVYITACTPNLEQQINSSRDATQQLANSLKSKLKGALQSGGPVEAISVCKTEAINISTEISKDFGWQVSRTSLKIRNPSNAPDDWEKKTLLSFEQQRTSGADIKNLEAFEIFEDEQGKWFRYMKAIPTAEVCLMCHGETIAPPVKQKLTSLYPSDRATGYKVGEIRGAFTIKQPL